MWPPSLTPRRQRTCLAPTEGCQPRVLPAGAGERRRDRLPRSAGMADSPRPSAIKCNDKARTPAAQASRHADMQLQPSAGGPSKHRAPGDSRPAMRGAGTDDCMSEPQTTHARRSSHWPQSTTLLARARARARDTHTSRALPYIKRVRFADSPRTSLRGHRVKSLLFAPEASGHCADPQPEPYAPAAPPGQSRQRQRKQISSGSMQSARAAQLHGLDIPDALHSTADVSSTADVETQRGRTHAPPDTHCQAPAAAARAGLPHAVPLSQSHSPSERIPHTRARARA